MSQSHPDLQAPSVAHLAECNESRAANRRRLVVVLRDADEEALLASRILGLAQPRGLGILLLGIVRDASREPELRRKLVTIAAFLEEETARAYLAAHQGARAHPAEIQIEHGKDWLGRIRSLLRPGDVVACYSEQAVGVLEKPLSDILACSLDVPIYTFAGLRDQDRNRQSHLPEAASWLGSLASIGAFFVLQARIVTDVQGWAQPALLLLTLAAEVGLIWFLNSLFGQS